MMLAGIARRGRPRWPLTLILLAGLLPLGGGTALAEEEPAPLVVADVLFPESRGWVALAQAPALGAREVKARRPALEGAYQQSRKANRGFDSVLEAPGCSFIKQVFQEGEASAFHRVDVNHDGQEDVVYVGNALCAEGSATVIWYGKAGGGYRLDPGVPFPVEILRVAPDGKQAVSVAPGCCGSPTSEYFLGTAAVPRLGMAVAHVNSARLPLPGERLTKGRAFTLKHPGRLRSAPEIADQYDGDMSEFLRRAVFGNVLRDYLAGASGVVVAEKSVAAPGAGTPKTWRFVVMDESADVKVTHDPFNGGVRSGWLPAE